MTTERTEVGRDIEAALGEVLAHVSGETKLPCRIVDDPDASRIVALRRRFRRSRAAPSGCSANTTPKKCPDRTTSPARC